VSLILALLLAAPPAAMVFVQVPPAARPEPLAEGLRAASWGEGARIVLLSPAGRARVLTADFASAADPEVSFDGKRIAFAGRRTKEDPWCLYEMNADGTGVRKIGCGPGEARHPVYQTSVHTLTATSTEEWTLVAFVGTNPGQADEYGTPGATSLYSSRLDGSALRRLTFGLSSESDPYLLPDGRMIFAAWQRQGLEGGLQGRVVLRGVNLDGTDVARFVTDEGQRVKRTPCLTREGLVVFVEGDALRGDGSGSLGAVRYRRNLHSYRSLTGQGDGLFHSPSPHPEGGVLVSWRSPSSGTYGVYRFAPATGLKTKVFDDAAWDDVQAKVVAPRPRPDGRSSVVKDDEPTAGLYGLDVNITDLPREMLPPGTGKRLRLLEGVPRPAGGATPNPSLALRRLLGEADLAEDGSFHLTVPANTPLQIQLLDADGLALRSSAWIWARNKENAGCIGCHEDGERTPPNRFVKALASPPVAMTLPESVRRTVDYRHDVAPIVRARCASCHGEGSSTPRLDGLDAESDEPGPAYEILLADHVDAGRARTSRLVWHLFGRNTSRPWDHEDWGREVKRAPPGQPELTEAERRTFVEWIDMGALWDARAESAAAVKGGDR